MFKEVWVWGLGFRVWGLGGLDWIIVASRFVSAKIEKKWNYDS